MTTEEDFQKALDKDIRDWQTRLVFADWLQERNDPRAEGMRSLGVLKIYPKMASNDINASWFCISWKAFQLGENYVWKIPLGWYMELPASYIPSLRAPYIPSMTMSMIFPSRRQAEDAAAIAFGLLSEEQKARILAVAD
jgi:uncharacterized protein (TIGR02996 family)